MIESIIGTGINETWKGFVTVETVTMLRQIESMVGNYYTPSQEKVLRFMQTDLNKLKVVILGQDPYSTPGVANGRAFQPSNLEHWTQPFKHISLKNIVRAIYAAENNIKQYEDIPTYYEISYLMTTGNFNINSPQKWFDSLESQGVLLLNTSLTCNIGESNSHKHIWKDFTQCVLYYISKSNPIWFLWGKESICAANDISGMKYESRHPMMCSSKYTDDFLRNKCFLETKEMVDWLGNTF